MKKMMNQQSSWSSCFPSGFVPLVIDTDKNCEQLPKVKKVKRFEIQSLSSEVFLRGLRSGWRTDKTRQNNAVSPQVAKAVALLDSWDNEDAQEQKETWEYLVKALDEDRLSDRNLFS
jgi:hypothetical protein